MRWFRANKQFGGRLGLFALALQLVLTFGHVHAPARVSNASSVLEVALASGTAPQHPSHNGPVDPDCPVCVLIQLSATSAPSVAPDLPLPMPTNFVALKPTAALTVAIAPVFETRARAPPQA
jgi:hypothetical protein